jgi:hypothetical protein
LLRWPDVQFDLAAPGPDRAEQAEAEPVLSGFGRGEEDERMTRLLSRGTGDSCFPGCHDGPAVIFAIGDERTRMSEPVCPSTVIAVMRTPLARFPLSEHRT